MENKKGNKKKGGGRNRQVDSDEENLLNAEIEMQIHDEIDKAQEGDSTLDGAGNVGEVEAEDVSEQNDITMSGGSIFSFVAPQALPTLRNSDATNREPVTPTKFSENPSFLKRSINDLSFTPEPVTRKRFSQTQDNILLTQILSKLDLLSNTVESQTAHISALEKRIEELTFHSKGSTQASKANQVAAKKIETMADRVAAMAATSPAQSNSANVNPGQESSQTSSSLKKASPHLVLDLSECAPSLNERPLKEIRQHLQASIKRSDQRHRNSRHVKRQPQRSSLFCVCSITSPRGRSSNALR